VITEGSRTVLIVEDETAIAETIIYALQTEGFIALWKASGQDALAAVRQRAIALIVLDVGLPDMSGFDVCREIRRTKNVPVIFLTARSEEIDKVVGLELGADDYMAKPFSPRELTARVRAILRRVNGEPQNAANVAPLSTSWTHDSTRCRISFRGHALDLTRNEYRLLTTMILQPGRVFSREQLMAAAWEDPGAALDRTVDAHIKTLRAKIAAAAAGADPILTHRGLGYSLREDV
jgi:two-component system catabolic regulation response regulator CreB